MSTPAVTPNPDKLSGEDMSALVETYQHLKQASDPRADKVGAFIRQTVTSGNAEPLEPGNPEHAGFWKSLGSDLWNMVPNFKQNANSGPDMSGRVGAAAKLNEQQKTELTAENASRKAAGYSGTYRALAPVAEGLGANVSGMEQSAKEGDSAGVVGHAAAVPTAIAATEGITRGVPAVASAVKPYAAPVARATAKTFDIATFDRIGKIYNAWKNLPEEVRKNTAPPESPGVYPGGNYPENPGREFLQAQSLASGARPAAANPADALRSIPVKVEPSAVYPGAPLPATPAPELLNARTLAQGPRAVPQSPSAALGKIPVKTEPKPMPTPPEAQPTASDTLPRTFNGESALRQVLTGQDNVNLLKIAKSRGINVTKEAALKPGTADNLLINKIIDDLKPEELDEIRAQYLENTRFRHAFGDVGPEAWKTMSLQTYFPDLKIAQTVLDRTAKAIKTPETITIKLPAGKTEEDLSPLLQESLKRARAKRAAKAQ